MEIYKFNFSWGFREDNPYQNVTQNYLVTVICDCYL